MVHSAFLRRLVLLVLVLFVAASPVWAAFPAWESAAGELLAALRWLGGPAGAPLTEKSGCSIDPDGRQHCDPAAARRPVPIVTPKHGCSIDPAGAPHCDP